MLSICVGEMGMSVEEFYNLREFELEAIIRGRRKRWFEEWKKLQFLSYATVQSHSSKRVRAEDILPLADIEKDIFEDRGSEEHVEETVSEEERRRILADADEFARKLTEAHNGPINTESPIRDMSDPSKKN